MKVSEKLLNIRKEKALSQSEVAEKLGISRQTLSKWENGKSCPDAMFVKKICELYHLLFLFYQPLLFVFQLQIY